VVIVVNCWLWPKGIREKQPVWLHIYVFQEELLNWLRTNISCPFFTSEAINFGGSALQNVGPDWGSNLGPHYMCISATIWSSENDVVTRLPNPNSSTEGPSSGPLSTCSLLPFTKMMKYFHVTSNSITFIKHCKHVMGMCHFPFLCDQSIFFTFLFYFFVFCLLPSVFCFFFLIKKIALYQFNRN